MKITYIHQYFTTPSFAGGTRSYEFAKRLARDGHDVTVITTDAFFSPDDTKAGGTWRTCEIEGVSVHVLRSMYSKRRGFLARIAAFLAFMMHASLRSLRIDADIIYATSTPLTVAVPAILTSRFRHVPYVFEVRDLWPETPIAMGVLRNPVLILLARQLEKLAYRNASAIVCLSPDMAEGVREVLGAKKRPVEVVPNAADEDLFGPSAEVPDAHAVTIARLAGRKIVLYAGTFGHVNGVEYLVKVAARLRFREDIAFVLVGDGIRRNSVVAEAASLHVLDMNLFVLDPVPKRAIAGLMRAATLCVSTTIAVTELWKNSANKIFDAFAAGSPVAVNHRGWLAEVIEEHGAGIVLSPGNHAEAAEQIAAFLDDAEAVRAARAASRSLSQTRFSRELLYERLHSLLLRVIEARDR